MPRLKGSYEFQKSTSSDLCKVGFENVEHGGDLRCEDRVEGGLKVLIIENPEGVSQDVPEAKNVEDRSKEECPRHYILPEEVASESDVGDEDAYGDDGGKDASCEFEAVRRKREPEVEDVEGDGPSLQHHILNRSFLSELRHTNAVGVTIAIIGVQTHEQVPALDPCVRMKEEPGEGQTQQAPAVDIERFQSHKFS